MTTPGASDALLALVPRPPRPVHVSSAVRAQLDEGAGVLLLVGAIFLVVGGILSTVFCWGLWDDLRITQRLQTTTGRVLTSRVDPSTRINRRPVTRIEYLYEHAGQMHRGEVATISDDVIARLPSGAPAEVELDDANPALSRLAGTRLATFGLLGAFTLVFPLIGLAVVSSGLRLRGGARRVHSRGRAVVGQLTSRTQAWGGKAGRVLLSWRFDHDGRPHYGSAVFRDVPGLSGLVPQSAVVVIYDERRPARSVLFVR